MGQAASHERRASISPTKGLSDRFKLSENVRYRIIDRQAVILHLGAGKVHSLNEVGARILELLDGNQQLDEIVARLEHEYEVAVEDLRGDLFRLLDQLLDAGIVEEV